MNLYIVVLTKTENGTLYSNINLLAARSEEEAVAIAQNALFADVLDFTNHTSCVVQVDTASLKHALVEIDKYNEN